MSAFGEMITLQCHHCGPVNVTSKSVRLFQCKEDGWLTVRFRCSSCFAIWTPVAPDSLRQDLAFHGIAAELWSVHDANGPIPTRSRRKYRRRFWIRKQAGFKVQDCDRLRKDMDTVDWFTKLAASVGSSPS